MASKVSSARKNGGSTKSRGNDVSKWRCHLHLKKRVPRKHRYLQEISNAAREGSKVTYCFMRDKSQATAVCSDAKMKGVVSDCEVGEGKFRELGQ